MTAFLNRLKSEPVLIVTALIVTLTAAQDALTGGADTSTVVFAALQALLGFVARQLVTPVSSPTLKAGTEVAVKGSEDAVVIQPTPPGPEGLDAP